MLQEAALKHSDFTTFRFIIHQSKSIRSALEDLSIELEHRTESHEIIDDSTVE